jgi:hypothetical protein
MRFNKFKAATTATGFSRCRFAYVRLDAESNFRPSPHPDPLAIGGGEGGRKPGEGFSSRLSDFCSGNGLIIGPTIFAP